MAKQRVVNPKFWDDIYIQNLDPTEKLLYIYCFTNPLVTMCGIYEFSPKTAAFHTGLEKEMVEKVLSRFERDGKMFYVSGWLFVKNFLKHQILNPSVLQGIESTLQDIPYEVLAQIKEILQSEAERIQSISSVSPLWQILKSKFKSKSLISGQSGLAEPLFKEGQENRKEIEELFEKFWGTYPKKVKKKKAKEIWMKMKPGRELVEKIITQVNRQKCSLQWKESGGKFIPHPTTYLNQERWEDEMEIGKQRSGKFDNITTKA